MKTYAENKRGKFNYAISEEYEAGIVLSGAEVKSIRAGQISLKESFGTIISGEAMLTNAHISPYKPARNEGYDPTQGRKLLLKKSEIESIARKLQSTGFSLIPLKVYDKNGKIKVLLGLGRGKKKYDKREAIRKREQDRDIKRVLKDGK